MGMSLSMTKKIIILFFVLFWGCENSINNLSDKDKIYGSGRIVSESREAAECTGVIISGVGNVYLRHDSLQKIRIESDDNIINYVITKNQNGVLFIGLKDGSYSNITLNVYVSLKSIASTTIEGSGSIVTENAVNCTNLNSVINGSGNIRLEGTCNFLSAIINGSGNLNTSRLITGKCNSVINGSGICRVNVTDELTAEVNGSGTIIYSGNPENVQTSIAGSGIIAKE